MISQATIQQIQSRIDIIEIIGSFVKLKKRGVNYLGLCPFHNEKTPSFTVSPVKEIYKCFGCGKSGNTIGFLMDLEKYSYVEALKWLAAKYDVPVEETELSPEKKAKQQEADSLYILNNFAQNFFSQFLFEEGEGLEIGLSYLKERGFREDIIRKFQLGYNPASGNGFTSAAQKAQYQKEMLLLSGLSVERNQKLVDNYRGRIIFPVHNQSGKVLGFGARIIQSNDKAPKYINTPENELYVKSRILYGSYFARQAIDKADECLLVEGYTDVISLHQAGIENVVASGGTSLTPDQLRLIKKYTNNLTILYDGDSAGIKAAMRGLDLALEEGLNVKLALIPDNEDPDSYMHKIGAKAFLEFIGENKQDFILFQLGISLKDAGQDSQKKSAIVNQIADTISRLDKPEDFTRRQDYIRQVSQILKIDEAGMLNLVNKFIRERIQKFQQKFSEPQDFSATPIPETTGLDVIPELLPKDDLQERAFVRSLIEFGLKPWDEEKSVADFLLFEFDEKEISESFDNKVLLDIIALYRKWYDEGIQPTEKNFLYHEDKNLHSLILSVMETNVEISPNWKNFYEGHIATREDLYRAEVKGTLNYLILRKVKRLIELNQQDMENCTDPMDQLTLIQTHATLKTLEMQLTKEVGTVVYK
ncbi:MAG: DNA primase [Chitinophagaceae bacterium]|nr:DNA primase [Bacteroidota bacterium]MCC6259185.1 DNA primase [Chitinophagaceae bacterium]MCW5916873.1 DNA primase [Ferruginibacter sp.]